MESGRDEKIAELFGVVKNDKGIGYWIPREEV
jgi:hypothetical protein